MARAVTTVAPPALTSLVSASTDLALASSAWSVARTAPLRTSAPVPTFRRKRRKTASSLNAVSISVVGT